MNKASEDRIPRKWEYIADQLRMLNAPKKVINAAVELDNIMVKLGLGYNTPYWENEDYPESPEELFSLIFCQSSCTACGECDYRCDICKLGVDGNCTPRSKYADGYFGIVGLWSRKNLR